MWHIPWEILYERSWIGIADVIRARTSYPLLPWIGVIALGYVIGPRFSTKTETAERNRTLLLAGLSLIAAFVVPRWLNVYGDLPRLTDVDFPISLISFCLLQNTYLHYYLAYLRLALDLY